MTKVCSECLEEKPLDQYGWAKDKRTPSGGCYRAKCNSCRSATQRAYNKDNRQTRKAYQDKYHSENRPKWAHYGAKRRARQKCATPEWLTEEDWASIKSIYVTRDKISCDGVEYQVDHIVPLQGKNVCGLHVPWNLQIITKEENLVKSNTNPHSDDAIKRLSDNSELR